MAGFIDFREWRKPSRHRSPPPRTMSRQVGDQDLGDHARRSRGAHSHAAPLKVTEADFDNLLENVQMPQQQFVFGGANTSRGHTRHPSPMDGSRHKSVGGSSTARAYRTEREDVSMVDALPPTAPKGAHFLSHEPCFLHHHQEGTTAFSHALCSGHDHIFVVLPVKHGEVERRRDLSGPNWLSARSALVELKGLKLTKHNHPVRGIARGREIIGRLSGRLVNDSTMDTHDRSPRVRNDRYSGKVLASRLDDIMRSRQARANKDAYIRELHRSPHTNKVLDQRRASQAPANLFDPNGVIKELHAATAELKRAAAEYHSRPKFESSASSEHVSGHREAVRDHHPSQSRATTAYIHPSRLASMAREASPVAEPEPEPIRRTGANKEPLVRRKNVKTEPAYTGYPAAAAAAASTESQVQEEGVSLTPTISKIDVNEQLRQRLQYQLRLNELRKPTPSTSLRRSSLVDPQKPGSFLKRVDKMTISSESGEIHESYGPSSIESHPNVSSSHKRLMNSSAGDMDTAGSKRVKIECEDTDINRTREDARLVSQSNSHSSATDSAEKGTSIFVGNLPDGVTAKQLGILFKEYSVEEVVIPYKVGNTCLQPYAFISVATPELAKKAVAAFNNQTLGDCMIHVELALKPGERRDLGDKGARVFVGNLDGATAEEDIWKLFKEFSVQGVTVHKRERDGRALYAFVDLATPVLAEQAIARLNGVWLLNRMIRVQPTQTETFSPNRPARLETGQSESLPDAGRHSERLDAEAMDVEPMDEARDLEMDEGVHLPGYAPN